MVKVYAVSLALGLAGLALVVLGGSLAENLGKPRRDPGIVINKVGRMTIGGLVGFGMGGMSAEFSPLGFEWGVSLVIALVASAAAVLWVRYASRTADL